MERRPDATSKQGLQPGIFDGGRKKSDKNLHRPFNQKVSNVRHVPSGQVFNQRLKFLMDKFWECKWSWSKFQAD